MAGNDKDRELSADRPEDKTANDRTGYAARNTNSHVVDLTGSDEDEDQDEDLKAAIALSLQDQQFQSSSTESASHVDALCKGQADRVKLSQVDTRETLKDSNSRVDSQFLGLDRKQMEADRLARLKRKRGTATEERTISPPALRRSNPPSNLTTSVLPARSHPPSNKNKVENVATAAVSRPAAGVSHNTSYITGEVFLTSLNKSTPRSISFTELLTPTVEGTILRSAFLSTFIVDFDWLFPHFDTRNVSFVLALHARGEQEKSILRQDFEGIPNVRLVFPFVGANVNCMHAKPMLLFYENMSTGLSHAICRIVIPSANLTPADWGHGGVMENIVFVIDLPSRDGSHSDAGGNNTRFKDNLMLTLKSMGIPNDVVEKLNTFDFSNTESIGFVHTIGGSHPIPTAGNTSTIRTFFDTKSSTTKAQGATSTRAPYIRTGIFSLSDTVRTLGLEISNDDKSYPPKVDFITSSMGNLREPFLHSLMLAVCGEASDVPAIPKSQATLTDNLSIYFPSRHTVETSKGGSRAAGTICFQSKWWDEQEKGFPRDKVLDCVGVRQDGILMHSKVLFVRFAKPKKAVLEVLDQRSSFGRGQITSPVVNNSSSCTTTYAGWVYVGSANLSESAWGSLVTDRKTGQLKMSCRNWESGVIIPVSLKAEHQDKNLHELSLEEVFGDIVPVPVKYPGIGLEGSGRKPWFFNG